MGYRGTMPNSKSAVALLEIDDETKEKNELGTGVVINKRFVLTTQHCLSQKHKNILIFSASDLKYANRFKAIKVHIPMINCGVFTTEVIEKSDFGRLGEFNEPDVKKEKLVLIELEKDYALPSYPKAQDKVIAIAEINKTLVVLGAGREETNPAKSKSLIFENSFWVSVLTNNNNTMYETQGFEMYPGIAEKKDSGGPYIIKDGNGKEEVVAIRVARDEDKGNLRTTLAIAVAPYTKWINEVIK